MTGSGNQYTLFSRDIIPHRQEETRAALEFLGADPQFAGRCLQDRERTVGLELEEADRLLSPDAVNGKELYSALLKDEAPPD